MNEIRQLNARMESMMGRVDVLNSDNRELRKVVETTAQNRTFLETRLQETMAQLERERQARLEAESRADVNSAAQDFNSDVVDPAQFAEIYRGLQPHLQRRDQMISNLSSENQKLNGIIDSLRRESDEKINGLRKEILERQVRRDVPDITTLLSDKVFEEFLSQQIPGSRRTRLQELQDAYRDGDDVFIKSVVEDYKKRGNPTPVPAADPPRSLQHQTPQQPVKAQAITEDMVQGAFQKQLAGEITLEEFKEIQARYKQQQLQAVGT